MKARIVLALALILLMAGSAPVAAGGATVPFRADMRTSCVEIWDFDTLIVTIDCSGEGKATHLGSSTLESTTHVDLVSLTTTPPPWDQLGGVTLIAANGDRLNLYIEGTVAPGVGEGSWEVVDGGTGRFAGMMGSGVYLYSLGGDAWHLNLEGTLTKPE